MNDMNEGIIYVYNGDVYTEEDLLNLDRRKRYEIKNRHKRLTTFKEYYNRNLDEKRQHGRERYYFKCEINRLSSIEI